MTPPTPTQTTASDTTTFARVLLAHGRDELRFADTKASSLFAITGAVAGIAAGAAVTLSWNPARLALPVAVLSWAAIGAIVVSVLLTGAAAYPRTRAGAKRDAGRVAYFGDVARCSDAGALRQALSRSAGEEYTLLTEELLAVSRTVAVKYRLIRASQWVLLIGCFAAVVAFLISV
jgi:hypothetical protein